MTTPTRAALPTRDIGVPDLAYGTWGQGLLSEWWETTADLIWPQSVITYGRMRNDPQLKAVLGAFMLPIYRATWVLDPTGCRDEVVQLCSDDLGVSVLGGDDAPGPARRRGVIWHRHLRSALGMLTYGHSIFERRYEIREDGMAHLANLGERMPWTVARMHIGHDGIMQDITQTTQEEPIPANRLAWYAYQQEGANWAGISMLRPAFGAWLLKHETWRVHATSIRRFGMGVPYVEAPPGASQQQVQQARDLAGAMRAGDQAGVGLPAGFKPLLMGLTGSVPDALGFIQYLDRAMAKMVLAGLIELGQTETGSRALGETFLDLFLLALQAVADEVATTATSGWPGMPGILTDLVDQNWGEDEPAPRLVCTDVGENYEVTAEAIAKLMQFGGLQGDESLDQWIRKAWRFPKRETPYVTLPALPPTPPPESKTPPVLPSGGPLPAAPEGAPSPPPAQARRKVAARAASAKVRAEQIKASGWDSTGHQHDWQHALDGLVLAWKDVQITQRNALTDAVVEAVRKDRTDWLALAPPPLGDGPDLLAAAMAQVANSGVSSAIREAASQGVVIDPERVHVDTARFAKVATARASMLAQGMAQAASTKALQVAAAEPGDQPPSVPPVPVHPATPKAPKPPPRQTKQPPPPPPPPPPLPIVPITPDDAGDFVDASIQAMSGRSLWDQLGAALTMAQNTGRVAVMEAAPESAGTAKYVASETLDQNTCDECAGVDGTEYDTLTDAEAAYPTGGYVNCEGFARCRGTVIAIWGGDGGG